MCMHMQLAWGALCSLTGTSLRSAAWALLGRPPLHTSRQLQSIFREYCAM